MSRLPKILIVNDDGIYAPGIRHLWNSLKNIADLTVVAPASEQSAVGAGITLRSPLRVNKIDWIDNSQAWCITGTPADCVKLALSTILKSKPDLIVSGINRGSNAGRNVIYSGTVGGVIEGILQNIPGVAFSCLDYVNVDYQFVEPFIPKIVDYVLKNPLPKGTLLNVNFPQKSMGIKGIKLTRQGKEMWAEDPAERHHPVEGHSYYWLGAKLLKFDEHEESDIHWLNKGYVAAVPVHIEELTDHMHLQKNKEHFESSFNL